MLQKDPAARMPKRRKLCAYSGPDPSVEEIEAEFWRIVEAPDQVRSPARVGPVKDC